MANPSTGFGGAGTEVLRRSYRDGQTNSEGTLITGVANHIYTILSIIVCEKSNASRNFHLYVDPDAGGTDFNLLDTQAIGAMETFVFNDRFVLTETDKLHCNASSGANFDIICSYIDQQLA